MGSNYSNSRFESPLRYPGGKTCIYPFISRLFYENDLIGSAYAEPYAGGSGLALKLLYNEYVSEVFINDLDKSIYKFWKVIIEYNLIFCDWIEELDITIENWHYYKQILHNQEKYSDLEIAKAVFYLNRTNISGVIKGGIIGGQAQQGKYKMNARFNKEDLIKRINRIELFKKRIKVSNLDGINFINKMNKLNENIFIYIDPPYVQKGADLYMNFYSEKDHQKLARSISLVDKRWLISYDNHELILRLYKDQKKILYKLSQSASNRIGDEILVFSNKLKYTDSISNLKDAIFI